MGHALRVETFIDQHRVTDGVDWVEITPAEAHYLEASGQIARCLGNCHPGTYHPIKTWAEIGEATALFLRGVA